MTNEEFQIKYFEIINDFRCNSKPTSISKEEQGENPVLKMLYKAKEKNEEVTPSQISKKFFISTARVARLLNQLEKKEFIYRSKSKTDTRITIINLTKTGEKKATEIIEKTVKLRDILLSNITDEEKELMLNVLNKMLNNLKGANNV